MLSVLLHFMCDETAWLKVNNAVKGLASLARLLTYEGASGLTYVAEKGFACH